METTTVAIIGGGFSGLGVAHELQTAGIDDFVILEKASQLGGTWRDNTYPGCACDVPSALYSFSFAPNPDWDRVFAEQPEIQRYLLDVADQLNVHPHVRLNCKLIGARWDEQTAFWMLETAQGPLRARVVVAGTGPLHEPSIPALPGLETFEGDTFHSARWRHDLDLAGRRVVVVGTGSSAIQFVPHIQPTAGHLTIFQRTVPWVLPKPDHAIPAIEKAAMRYVPGLRRAWRGTIYGLLELLQYAERDPQRMRKLQKLGLWQLNRQVKDPDLRRKLTPDFVLGCKRLLLSNTWYPAIQQPNVDVVHAGVREVTKTGVIDANGDHHDCDTIIFATGFHVTDPPIAEVVHGRSGQRLADQWDGSPRAYLGSTVVGFPNLFVTLGPNMGNGHTSALILIEAQARYIVDSVKRMEADNIASFEVRPDVEARWNDDVQEALKGTVWNAGGCASWYLDKNGTNRSIYPWSTLDVRRRLRRFDVAAYKADKRLVVAVTGGAQGIGLAVAEAFSRIGATACIGDIDLQRARESAAKVGGQAWHLDVTQADSMNAFVDAIEADVGPIDVFVNNAGVMPTGRFLDQDAAVEQATFAINYHGVAHGMRAVMPRMKARRRGHVVNIASMAGKLHFAGGSTYVATKHAVVGMSAAVRDELEGTGVTLTTIMPGPVTTRLADGIPLDRLGAVPPAAVAAAVVGSWRNPEPEIAVPRVLTGYTPLAWLAGPRIMRRVRALLGADRVLTSANASARRAYESTFKPPVPLREAS